MDKQEPVKKIWTKHELRRIFWGGWWMVHNEDIPFCHAQGTGGNGKIVSNEQNRESW